MSSRPSTLVGAVGSVNPVMSHSPIGIGDLFWNANPHTGPLPEFLASVNGQLCGSSGHIRSTTPTDSVWISESSVCREHSVLDPLSDHFCSLVKFGRCWHAAPAPQAWEFQKVATLIPDIPLPSKADSVAAWTRVATPEDVWSDCLQGDIDKCWLQWSRDAEAYLHPGEGCPEQIWSCPPRQGTQT